MLRPSLSVVIIAYNMAREIPRTLRSLSPAMQRGVDVGDYEVILIDNGSTQPCDETECRRWLPDVRLIHLAPALPSPVAAINRGLAEARGSLIGVWIDGARLASPGLLRGALEAARLHARPVIGTIGFHLGPDIQANSIRQGYNQAREDALLTDVNWTDDGYRLFTISSFAGSTHAGWFMPIAESNAVFMTPALWRELGGFDARFSLPGGGLANLDLWRRAVQAPDTQVIILLGEGTFHQVHGGIATNATRDMFPLFAAEYRHIRGEDYAVPAISPLFVGRLPAPSLPKIAWSATEAVRRLGVPTEFPGE